MRKLMWALVAACAVLAGCADKPVAPFASAPFSVARKGNALSIPFTVPPATPLEHTYMLASKYQGPVAGDPLLDIETVADSAVFEPIASWVTVEREFPHGK